MQKKEVSVVTSHLAMWYNNNDNTNITCPNMIAPLYLLLQSIHRSRPLYIYALYLVQVEQQPMPPFHRRVPAVDSYDAN